jgi:predicted RecB family nuclease
MNLSKTRYLSGLQCHKLLWHQFNAKHLIPPTDPATQFLFDEGHAVGNLAKWLFPGGIAVGEGIINLTTVSKLSLDALRHRKPLFEAGFLFNNAYARADILVPVGKSGWDIVEVKSSTEVKDVNITDLAFQRFVYEGAGLTINRCFIYHVNNQYVRHGDIDVQEFFVKVDVTDQVREYLPQVAPSLTGMLEAISSRQCPDIAIGPQCTTPYECPLKDHCWSYLPDQNVLSLSHFKKEKAFDLIHNGICSILDLPEETSLSDKQRIQADSVRSNEPYVDADSIRTFLDRLEYPLYFLDFETFKTAIPMFDGSRPHQNIPFQFSLHMVRSEREAAIHHMHLAEGDGDPRPALMDRLRELLGTHGSIIAYNASFEKTTLKYVCEGYPQYEAFVDSLEPRIIDLIEPFRGFAYYHPAQHGSCSLKALLPALTGGGYDHLEIADGGTASLEYVRVMYGDVDEEERRRVRKQLEDYCELDTRAMIDILARLRELASAHRR